MDSSILMQRTKMLALCIIRLIKNLPKDVVTSVIVKQLIRCGTSIGANYRASLRARSQADFIAKLGIVIEEADETIYWLELLVEAEIIDLSAVKDLLDEADQLVAIFVATVKKSKNK